MLAITKCYDQLLFLEHTEKWNYVRSNASEDSNNMLLSETTMPINAVLAEYEVQRSIQSSWWIIGEFLERDADRSMIGTGRDPQRFCGYPLQTVRLSPLRRQRAADSALLLGSTVPVLQHMRPATARVEAGIRAALVYHPRCATDRA